MQHNCFRASDCFQAICRAICIFLLCILLQLFCFSFPPFIFHNAKPCLCFLLGCMVSSFRICCYFWLPSKLCMILIAISQNHNLPQTSPNISRRKSQEPLPRPEGPELWISPPFCQRCPAQPLPQGVKTSAHRPTHTAPSWPRQATEKQLVQAKAHRKKMLTWGFKN